MKTGARKRNYELPSNNHQHCRVKNFFTVSCITTVYSVLAFNFFSYRQLLLYIAFSSVCLLMLSIKTSQHSGPCVYWPFVTRVR